MGIGPVFAVPKALKMAGLTLDQIGLIELNEAFAAQALAVIQVLGLDPAKVNVNGGAIALGHPLGCTGAKLTASLLREMPRRGVKYGMVTMCVGGGMGAAGIFDEKIGDDCDVTHYVTQWIYGECEHARAAGHQEAEDAAAPGQVD